MSAPDGTFGVDPQAFMAEADEVPEVPAEPGSGSATAAEGIASLGRIEQELAGVEDALTRLDDGRYGVCDACGAAISEDWLAAHPAERRCTDHRSAGAP